MPNVTDSLISEGPDIFYSPEFRAVVEEHILVLQQNESTEKITIETHTAYQYENNLYGLLTYLEYPKQLHWIIMRINGLHSPNEFKRDTKQLVIPNTSLVDELVKLHNSKEGAL